MAGRPKGLPKTGGRKSGTPNKVTNDLKAIAQQFTEEAVRKLASIMRNSESPQAQVSAARELLDRGHGKAPQAIGGDPDNPVRAIIQVITGVPRAGHKRAD